ncbi:MAG: phenylacetic acid degradation operon negative regulatory protein PaaX [Rhodoplanes sp.]
MISRLLKQIKPKAKSVIVTIYGDAITHHGGSAWLGSIIKLAAPLGLNERVVRTSVFRLAKEDWLVADQVGRRSYYRLTEAGRHRFDTAHSRIYHHASRPWDGHWTFVIIDFAALKGKNGEALRSDLRWQGFGQLTAGVMLHPDPDKAALHQALVDADASKRALVMHAAAEMAPAPAAVRGLVERCWDLQRLAADYAAFLDTFRPVWQALHHAAHLDPETCFVVRTLLMHSYRRVLLRDPKLPDELLEANWPGASARLLCRNLYRLVQATAEQHVLAQLETADGAVPAAHPSYFMRFGGLGRAADAA